MFSPKSKEKCPDILYLWPANTDPLSLFQKLFTILKIFKKWGNIKNPLLEELFFNLHRRQYSLLTYFLKASNSTPWFPTFFFFHCCSSTIYQYTRFLFWNQKKLFCIPTSPAEYVAVNHNGISKVLASGGISFLASGNAMFV